MKRSYIFCLALLIIGLMFSFSSHWPLRASVAGYSGSAGKVTAKRAAQMSDQITLLAAGRGNPWINLRDGHALPTYYAGAAELGPVLQQNLATPLALASADFDEDGVPDLVSGYAYSDAGILTLHRGNADSIYPNSLEAQQRKARGEFIDSPFLPQARIFELPEAPEFLGAGDFDADGHWDLVAAARGSNALYLLQGNGQGGFGEAQKIELPGRVTAMICGEVNRRDGLTDVVVGIAGPYGPEALVFEGPEGALRSSPEAIDLPAEARAFAIGQLDDGYEMDLAIAAGSELLIVHGRDRILSLDEARQREVPPPTLTRLSFPFSINSIAVGNFIQDKDQRADLALLADDGTVHLLKRERKKGEKGRRKKGGEEIWQVKSSVSLSGSARLLVPARISNLPSDNLVVVDGVNHQLHILMNDTVDLSARLRVAASLDVEEEPAAVLPMRLNVDALSDLIVLRNGQSAPSAVMTISPLTATVTNTSDSGPGSFREALSSGGTITFSIPGPGPYVITLLSSLPQIAPAPGGIGPVTIDGTTQPGFTGTPIIVLNGGGSVFITALNISAGSSVVRGLVINGFGGSPGIVLSGGGNNIIEGNYIGIGTGGSGSPLTTGNSLGIDIVSSSSNRIGGTTAAARNVIAANNANGIQFRDNGVSTGNLMEGNYIGTNAAGTARGSTSSDGSGVAFVGAQSGNTVGGTTAGARNVISGQNFGVYLGGNSSNLVQGNYIGTDFRGTTGIGNSQANVNMITTGSTHTIGGTTPAARNIISGGQNSGINSGTTTTTTCLVQGNYIGTQADGTSPLGNLVGVNAGGGTMVGGTVSGAGNVIAFNTQTGVQVTFGSNPILSNSIHDNGTLGIDLFVGGAPAGTPGVTPNDLCDGDTGANNLQNFPVLTSATSSSAGTTITGTLNSLASTTFRIEFFSNSACDPSGYGEGETFIGSTIVTTDSSCNASFSAAFTTSIPVGQTITATATRMSGTPLIPIETSEFSQCIAVNPAPTADLLVTKTDSPDPVIVENNLTYTIIVSNNGPSTATGVALTDPLPSGVTFVSATASQGSCTQSGGTVTCSLGSLVNGASTTVTIVVTPTASGTITNTASVTANESDPNTANNSATESTTVNPVPTADLSVTISDSPDPVTVGNNLTYTITVTNNGPSTATGVALTDPSPSGVTFVSVTNSQGSCNQSGGTVTCSLGTLANGATATVTIVVTPTAAGTVTNTASVTGDQSEPNSTNNTATESTTANPLASADLSVTKSGSPNPVTSGGNLTYTITVTNNGPSTATGVTLTDRLPAGLNFVSVTSNKGSCTQASGTVTCNLGTFNNGASSTITIVTTATTPGTISNSATVRGSEADPNPGNNIATETTTVNAPAAVADLSVTKTDSPDPIVVGNNLTYTIVVRSNGPDAATGVTLSDRLPVDVTFVSATSTRGSCAQAGTIVTCSIGSMANDTTATITVIVTPNATGTITNTAVVTGNETDPNTANNIATASTSVFATATADLLILSISDSPDPAFVGNDLTYDIVVNNNGPFDATGVTLTDRLPSSVTFVSASSSCTYSVGIVTCNLGNVSTSIGRVVTIVVRPTTTGTISNTVSVTGNEIDPNTANNTATEVTTVNAPSADLSITMTDSPDPVSQGTDLTYVIGFGNNGPVAATGAVLTDNLPPNVTFVSAINPLGNCSESGGTVTCNLGNLPVGVHGSVLIVVRPTRQGMLNNRATITANEADPNTANNTAMQSTTVVAAPDLLVFMGDSPDPVAVGIDLTYTIDVVNSRTVAGPPATGVVLSDTLPANTTFVSATTGQGSCNQSGGTLTCNIGFMPRGARVRIIVVVRPTLPGTLTNTASVTANEPDPNTSNNTATETTTVSNGTADLSVTTTDSPDPATLGTTLLTYTITITNNGPDDATGVRLTDMLGPFVIFSQFRSTPGCILDLSRNTVTCNIGNLPSGATATFTIVVEPINIGQITNTARVTADVVDVFDPNLTNNEATETTTVNPRFADLFVFQFDSPDPVAAGSDLTYEIHVQNFGPDTASAVVLTNRLPQTRDFVFISATTSSLLGSCSFSPGSNIPGDDPTVTCNLGALASGASTTVNLVVRPIRPGNFFNSASVTSMGGEVDPNPSNNSRIERTIVH